MALILKLQLQFFLIMFLSDACTFLFRLMLSLFFFFAYFCIDVFLASLIDINVFLPC